MWLHKEIDTAEYRQDRKAIKKRINDNRKKTVVAVKKISAVADLIGPNAKASWEKLPPERRNVVLRFLFSAVVIGPGDTKRTPNTADFGRVDIEQNELT